MRRPLAFAAFNGDLAYALYQVRGRGTKALSAAQEGSTLDVIGPLGNAFPLPVDGEQPFLLGGGIGIGPLLFLHAAILAMKRPADLDVLLFLGFRSAAAIPRFDKALETLSAKDSRRKAGLESLSKSLSLANIATDDGSSGYAGTVLGALGAPLTARSAAAASLRHYYACGPGRCWRPPTR